MEVSDFLDLEKKYSCKIIAVSKLQSKEKIISLARLGFQNFGENYIQEALEKQEQLSRLNLQWHLIGPIQKNKTRKILGKFSLIHSIDSIEIAERINSQISENSERSQKQDVLLQVNLANEATKHGFHEQNLENALAKLTLMSRLNVIGLMTMPPLENMAEMNRQYFTKLRSLRDKLALKELSMGTSHDYQVALDEGATMIRLGTVLFGERPLKGK